MDLKNRAVARHKPDGRKKAMPNKPKAGAVELAASGLLPLDYMLSVMRDPTASAKRRDAMAARAAPYCHARYKSVKLERQDTAPNLPTEIKIRFFKPSGEDAVLRFATN